VGAGKTTTARLVGVELNMVTILEEVERHPFLNHYYSDPKRFALETEFAFMALHIHQVKQAEPVESMVSDFSPARNPIFGELNLSPSVVAFLRRTDEQLWEGLERPEVAIFLDVPPATCLERVRRRGHPMEQGLRVEQLQRLRSAYMSNLERLARRVVRLDLDGHESPEEVAMVVSQHIGLD